MRTIRTTAKAVPAFLATVVATGCTGSADAEVLSAGEMLDRANKTMRALTSVTVEGRTSVSSGGGYATRLTTDLESRCTVETRWGDGSAVAQIRIGDTDYLRPNRALQERWRGRPVPEAYDEDLWIKQSADEADPMNGLASCTREFASFGEATKGDPTEIGGRPAIPLVVEGDADPEGSYTFYVSTEGEPYLLKVVYKGSRYRSTTSFSAFDKPLEVHAPDPADVFDMAALTP